MNIFILDYNIKKNVEYYCDKHVVKMLTESCQILSTVYRKYDKNSPDLLYKSTHENHPCVIWTNNNIHNFLYLLELSVALYNEYQYRYNKPDKHKRNKEIIEYLCKYAYKLDLFYKGSKMTSFVQAMPEKYKNKDAVIAYRNYYLGEKQHLFKWTKRQVPDWIK